MKDNLTENSLIFFIDMRFLRAAPVQNDRKLS